ANSSWLTLLIASITFFFKPLSTPFGSWMYRTGSPLDLHCTPWYTDGKNPLPQTLLPASGVLPPEVSTTNPGRLLFSEPRPYVTHDPRLGLPSLALPVCINN